MKNLIYLFGVVSILIIQACSPTVNPKQESANPLSSWNDGDTKESIITFVNEVSDSNSENFVPVKDRIATFDNDGNLWSEQPMYYQMEFVIHQIKNLAIENPSWKDEYPYKAILEDDIEKMLELGHNDLFKLIYASHGSMDGDDFVLAVQNWLQSTKHPRFNRPYNELTYLPMIELMDYLRANDFTVFIVSGGGIDFMRAWAEEAYQVPNHQIIGSSLKSQFIEENESFTIEKLPEINFVDDKAGKPVGIYHHIGRRPIFASGNSDGDLQMLQYTAAGKGPSFMLYLHHTDSVREWAYDRESHIGRLDKGLDYAKANDWTVIDMAEDWNKVYAFD